MDAISFIELIFHRFGWNRWATLTISTNSIFTHFMWKLAVKTFQVNMSCATIFHYHHGNFSCATKIFLENWPLRQYGMTTEGIPWTAMILCRKNDFKAFLTQLLTSWLDFFPYSITKCSASSWQLVINCKMYSVLEAPLAQIAQPTYSTAWNASQRVVERERERVFFVPEKVCQSPAFVMFWQMCFVWSDQKTNATAYKRPAAVKVDKIGCLSHST